jgi:hypothetical protein
MKVLVLSPHLTARQGHRAMARWRILGQETVSIVGSDEKSGFPYKIAKSCCRMEIYCWSGFSRDALAPEHRG